MKTFVRSLSDTQKWLAALGGLIVLAALGYGVWAYTDLKKESGFLQTSLVETQEALANSKAENERLVYDLHVARGDIENFSSQVGELSGTIKKLNERDPELLKKYSKVYFLNENYVPRGLVDIGSSYLYRSAKPLQFLSKAYPYLQRLLDDAAAAGLDLKIISAYRSFNTQEALKSNYKVVYGAGTANQFSADQGYSEHQLGTAIDFTTTKVGETFSGFSKTAEYAWLIENAWKYGFILSYPEKNSYYVYEPWHWRFVGKALAERLRVDKTQFYDLEQRQIDPYLIQIFD
jgi:LAS superfamily LD-carboxypeptidase LdcB